MADGTIDIVQTTTPTEPTFCPYCGKSGCLKETTSGGDLELGCWDGKNFCWDGPAPAYVCACGGVFTRPPTEDEIHSDCACLRGQCEDEDGCDVYVAAAIA